MTLKEAVLKSLEDINDITNYLAVLNHINEKNYYDFGWFGIANRWLFWALPLYLIIYYLISLLENDFLNKVVSKLLFSNINKVYIINRILFYFLSSKLNHFIANF